jgi:hypothetical protein
MLYQEFTLAPRTTLPGLAFINYGHVTLRGLLTRFYKAIVS